MRDARTGRRSASQNMEDVGREGEVTPQRVEQVYEQMCDSQWWKDLTVRLSPHVMSLCLTLHVILKEKLNPGATISPIIIASDKTNLSTFSGDKQAWPVYITIGNIDNETRWQPSKGATVLLGYLPISKLLCFEEKDRQAQGYRLIHYAMELLLRPLIDAGNNRKKMLCADGQFRDIYPVLAAYITDFPEQCLVCCTKQNRCPVCTVHPNAHGDRIPLDSIQYRSPVETLADLQTGVNENLSSVKKPFWADLPHANIFRCITPDLLHQLHKGVFKDHLVKWTTSGHEAEVDQRFMRIPAYPGLRTFPRGISKITQWTGNEYRQMEKIFLPILCGIHDDPRVITAARALMDFIYLAHYPSHSTTTLEAMETAFRTFHDNKQGFLDLGAREDFNIPKVHAMNHYIAAIMYLGSCDSLSTEISERLHIDLAKKAYRSTNRKHYLQQMVLWLERRDKMSWFAAYLNWAVPLATPMQPDQHQVAPATSPLPLYDDELYLLDDSEEPDGDYEPREDDDDSDHVRTDEVEVEPLAATTPLRDSAGWVNASSDAMDIDTDEIMQNQGYVGTAAEVMNVDSDEQTNNDPPPYTVTTGGTHAGKPAF